MDKPFSAACERNRAPILAVLREQLAGARSVLEIGSGTGQHAVHFAAALPHLRWQCSELPQQLAGLRLWQGEAGLPNLPPPWRLDVDGTWPDAQFDAVFTANTLHIAAWPSVQRLFCGLPRVLAPHGLFMAYGPFKFAGRFTSASNAAFDRALREGDATRGIRDIEALDALAQRAGLQRESRHDLPAHNQLIGWRRGGPCVVNSGVGGPR